MKINWKSKRTWLIATISFVIFGWVSLLYLGTDSRFQPPKTPAPPRCLDCNISQCDYPRWIARQKHKKAEFGDTKEQLNLGLTYMNGHTDPCDNSLNVPQDYAEAYFWLSLASEGSDRNRPNIDEAIKHLSAEQKAVVDKRIQEWKPLGDAKAIPK